MTPVFTTTTIFLIAVVARWIEGFAKVGPRVEARVFDL